MDNFRIQPARTALFRRNVYSTRITTSPTRALGRSGLNITRVGFGSWAIGGGGWSFGWGPQDDADSLATMRHAIKKGVNWVETAAAYGLGHSEEVVGALCENFPSQIGVHLHEVRAGLGRQQPHGPASPDAHSSVYSA
jgi:Aldo/keto reductase family